MIIPDRRRLLYFIVKHRTRRRIFSFSSFSSSSFSAHDCWCGPTMVWWWSSGPLRNHTHHTAHCCWRTHPLARHTSRPSGWRAWSASANLSMLWQELASSLAVWASGTGLSGWRIFHWWAAHHCPQCHQWQSHCCCCRRDHHSSPQTGQYQMWCLQRRCWLFESLLLLSRSWMAIFWCHCKHGMSPEPRL